MGQKSKVSKVCGIYRIFWNGIAKTDRIEQYCILLLFGIVEKHPPTRLAVERSNNYNFRKEILWHYGRDCRGVRVWIVNKDGQLCLGTICQEKEKILREEGYCIVSDRLFCVIRWLLPPLWVCLRGPRLVRHLQL